jgi:hypothetical protein
MLSKGQIEFYRFAGAAAMNGTLDNAAAVDQSSSYEPGTVSAKGVVRIPITTHGLLAGTVNKKPTHIFLAGSTNYNGIRRIVAIPDANNIDIAATYVAETFAGTETFMPAITFDEPWEFYGYEVHVGSAPATTANLIITKDSAAGSYWDANYLTQDMDTVTDVVEMFETPILLAPDDLVFVNWANADADTWGVEFKVRRLN